MVFFWLNSIDQAKERVAIRVSKGGHNIPPEIIERRYNRGIANLIKLYIPVCDYWLIVDNSKEEIVTVADGEYDIVKVIYNNDIWHTIQSGK